MSNTPLTPATSTEISIDAISIHATSIDAISINKISANLQHSAMLGTLGSDEHSTDLEHLTLSGMPAPEQDPRVCTPGQSIAQFFKLLTRSDLTEYFESLRLKIKAELEHAALDRNQ